jgi:hypothetical protein
MMTEGVVIGGPSLAHVFSPLARRTHTSHPTNYNKTTQMEIEHMIVKDSKTNY